jgi:hypothetical protein
MSGFRYPCFRTVRTLLTYGADVNAIDAVRYTPLHVFVSNSRICDAGAHLDCVNARKETPVDIASNSNTKQLIRTKMKFSLKCLCSQLIQKNNVPFHGTISTSFVSFVEKH